VVVDLYVLFLVALLALSLHFLDLSIPGLHVQLPLLLLHFDVFDFLCRVNILLNKAIAHILQVDVSAIPP
jgi:hypothetical protein